MERLSFSDVTVKKGKCASCGGKGGGELTLPNGTKVPLMCEACIEAADLADVEAARQARIEAAMTRAAARVGERLAELSLETYPTDAAGLAALAVAEEWLRRREAGERENLLLFGPVGVGKTGLAWGIVRRLIERGDDALLVNFRELLAELRQAFADRRAGVPIDYLRAYDVTVLALDDVGAERPTDFAREELANLVERRYTRRLPTIITSNYDPDDLAERIGHDDIVIGERIVSRLIEGATQWQIGGEDRRA